MIVLTTPTCHKCHALEIRTAGLDLLFLDATKDQTAVELAMEHGVTSVPVLIDNNTVIRDYDEIINYLGV